jgi:hypothetical protein
MLALATGCTTILGVTDVPVPVEGGTDGNGKMADDGSSSGSSSDSSNRSGSGSGSGSGSSSSGSSSSGAADSSADDLSTNDSGGVEASTDDALADSIGDDATAGESGGDDSSTVDTGVGDSSQDSLADARTCATPYNQVGCDRYVPGTTVSRGGRNWLCSDGNCVNCSMFVSCAPGGTGCPWGIVWADEGPCR